MSDIILFGTGNWYKKYGSLYRNDNVVALIDNDELKQNTVLDGIKVYAPRDIQRLRYDYICIMAGYHYAMDIQKQLIDLKVKKEKIFVSPPAYFAWNKEKSIKIISEEDVYRNEVVYLSASFFNGGGVRAGIYAIKALKEIFGGVTIICPGEGDVKQELLDIGVSLIIAPDISENNQLLWRYITSRKLIWINSIYFYYLIGSINKINNKTVWWLHNGESAWKNYDIPKEGIDTGNVKVLGVSEPVKEAYQLHTANKEMEIFPWYLDDCITEKIPKKNNKMVFAMIGTFDRVKAQDIFTHAIQQINPEERKRMEFLLVGQEFGTEYSKEIHNSYGDIKEIKWLGSMDHEDVLHLFSYIDVLVCPSREDMLPLVCAEAMMNSVPCIISTGVGMVSYVTHKKEALVFENENYSELASLMRWCLLNQDILKVIGSRGRRTYEQYFTKDAFQKRLMKLL